MPTAFIALGSNLGDRAAHLRHAAEAMNALPGTTVVRVSHHYETDPVGPPGQGPYLNAAAEICTELSPRDLLEGLLRIEREAGRDRSSDAVRWGPRPLDLDLLLYDDSMLNDPGLTLPHPRMHERAFVLQPLAEIAPNTRHPVVNQTISELLRNVQDD